MEALLKWFKRSVHRIAMLQSVAHLNAAGTCPTQAEAMRFCDTMAIVQASRYRIGRAAWRGYRFESHRSNGRAACRALLKAGLLEEIPVTPEGSKYRVDRGLTINWEMLGVLSDWMEENGAEEDQRLDTLLSKGGTLLDKEEWNPLPKWLSDLRSSVKVV